LIRINAIRDGAPDERDPMENQRRFLRDLEQQLAQDIEEDDEEEERSCGRGEDDARGSIGELVAQRPSYGGQ
ncbi:MAG: hypothetical protein LQ348_007228, partial [Seirophora lacunosa]